MLKQAIVAASRESIIVKVINRLKLVFAVHRDLLFHLALKNLKIQYKYAFLGFLWAFFVPLCLALVFWFLFSVVYSRPMPPLSIVTALFVWQFVSTSIMAGTNSIVDSGGMLKKVYFPREIIPISIVCSNLINFVLSLIVLVLFVLVYNLVKGISPIFPLAILFLPALVLLTLVLTSGIVLLTSCLQVFYRDVKYIVEIILMVWFYLSGVFFNVDLVNKGAQSWGMPWITQVFILNPMYDLFTMYRQAVLPKTVEGMVINISLYYPPWLMVLQTIVFTIAIFIFAYYQFMKREGELVDLI